MKINVFSLLLLFCTYNAEAIYLREYKMKDEQIRENFENLLFTNPSCIEDWNVYEQDIYNNADCSFFITRIQSAEKFFLIEYLSVLNYDNVVGFVKIKGINMFILGDVALFSEFFSETNNNCFFLNPKNREQRNIDSYSVPVPDDDPPVWYVIYDDKGKFILKDGGCW
ncbi:MAG: hypothetical protein WCU80_12065 [Paludibacteraceae bacterium]|nr:hypothetical protein [Paludibacteraceae bacterium]